MDNVQKRNICVIRNCLNENVAMFEGCCSNTDDLLTNMHMKVNAKFCWLEARCRALSGACGCRSLHEVATL
jgi:hypothetical protein